MDRAVEPFIGHGVPNYYPFPFGFLPNPSFSMAPYPISYPWMNMGGGVPATRREDADKKGSDLTSQTSTAVTEETPARCE